MVIPIRKNLISKSESGLLEDILKNLLFGKALQGGVLIFLISDIL
jgi:hypothetical protein